LIGTGSNTAGWAAWQFSNSISHSKEEQNAEEMFGPKEEDAANCVMRGFMIFTLYLTLV